MKQTKIFESEDGTTFATAAECRAHEEHEYLSHYLSDLAPVHIKDAFSRTNVQLADAIERAGSIIAAKRRESGELKRGKKADIAAQMDNIKKNMKAMP